MALLPVQLPCAAVQAMEPHLTSDMFLPPPVTRYRQQCEMAAQEEEAHMVLDFAERLNYNLGKVHDSVRSTSSDCLGRVWCVPAPALLPRLGKVGVMFSEQRQRKTPPGQGAWWSSAILLMLPAVLLERHATPIMSDMYAALLVYGTWGLALVLLCESMMGQIMVCATAMLLRCLGRRSLDSECLKWNMGKVSCGPVYGMWALCCCLPGYCGRLTMHHLHGACFLAGA